jgi:hypothetical protein
VDLYRRFDFDVSNKLSMHDPFKGRLDPKLRAAIAWIAGRNDRAWYALDVARKRLAALGVTEDAMFAFDHFHVAAAVWE